MTNRRYEKRFEGLKMSGISDTYMIFTKATGQKLTKAVYWRWYNRAFEKSVLEKKLPQPQRYPIVDWIKANKNNCRFIYATGGQEKETQYVLDRLGIRKYFDIENSITKNQCRFSKRTGIPFRKIKKKFGDCIVIADGGNDYKGARKANLGFLKIKPGATFKRKTIGRSFDL